MADDVRQRIVTSLFSKRGTSGALEEQYISHVKILEDAIPGNDDGGKKARYILLSLSLRGPALIHKSRENPNGSFSIGKTWELKDLTALEVHGRTPGFDITFARRYKWQTESWEDQEAFLIATVRLYRRIMGGQSPQLIGWQMPDGPGSSVASSGSNSATAYDGQRSGSPNPMVYGRQPNSAMRSPSPAGRPGGLRAPTPGNASYDQPSPTSGRPRVDGRQSPSPSPRSPYQNPASAEPRERAYPLRTPNKREISPAPQREPQREPPQQQQGRSGKRPPELERPSYERERSRDPGLPPTPRRAQAPRSDRAPSPGPTQQQQQQARFPASRSDRAPSPQPPQDAFYRNGATQSPVRSRAGSRPDRAPSPKASSQPEVPYIPPPAAPRRGERGERSRGPSPAPSSDTARQRTGSRPERVPSPTPPSPRRPKADNRSDRAPSPVPPPPAPEVRQRPRGNSRAEREPPEPSVTPRQRAGALPPANSISSSGRGAGAPVAVPTPPKQSFEISDVRERPPLPVALGQGTKKDPYARISFYDPANQATVDRLLSIEDRGVGEEESNEATMANIEEMLDGYEWASAGSTGSWDDPKGAADQIEARLLKELSALDAANMYSFVESDTRVATVLSYIDEALKELDEMDGAVTSYKIHLNAVNDDISYIQSQNRGLQVQTQNQRALLKELEDLLQTVHVDREALLMLTNQSLEKRSGLEKLEEAATELYKALQAGKDTDMAATMQRLDEYRTYNQQFCQRILDFLPMMISYQSDLVLKGKSKEQKQDPLVMASHAPMEDHLMSYSGLIRYMKEMDETRYVKLCGAYFGAAGQLYKDQVKLLLDAYLGQVKRATDEESDMNFAPVSSGSALSRGATMRRAGTIVRSPLDRGQRDKDKDKEKRGDLRGYEAFGRILDQICPFTYREEEFLSNFLQINDTGDTFADYMNLDSYFRRQAARWVGLQMIGITAHLERYKGDAEERGNTFLAKLLQRQQQKMVSYHARHLDELIKSIEATKLSSKKRRGVVHYIRYFPIFVNRVESQLAGADSFEIRTLVDTSYEKLVNAMFDSLQQMAKLEGEGEDKGQLNYHIILIENMHSFINDLSQQSLGSIAGFTRRAEVIYDENLSAYVRLVLRRPFQKLMDFVDGAEKLLKTMSPTDVGSNSSYNKSQLKKLIKDHTSKDIKRQIDGMFKRVEKHFAEGEDNAGNAASVAVLPGTVIYVVWKACEDEMVSLTERFFKFIATCHKEMNAEYSVADVESGFKKHRT
ncbi:related to Exocyst complex component Sec3 [Serendipita indica DSM 11827]|uniref:Related to Exocyst complex component Sec3 n=1 Tax=Serendipita indica (strain DSM 11827) TaxID=1109443 RepID=G4T8S2_SERID|nr:related to Exocyst complex component Sec3 [Serendipita indica DSM 11827]